MHKTIAEAKEHIQRLKPLIFRSKADVWLGVPFTALAACAHASEGSHIRIGAQNMSDLLAGALTGEVSALMIVEAGATFVILGHSERRKLFNENDNMINRKVKLALRSGLKVILCVGESREEREGGMTENIIKMQLDECLDDVDVSQIQNLTIAYEPIWAIGNNNPATPEVVEEIHHLCKNLLANLWNPDLARHIRILYGGSVNASNAAKFMSLPSVDGLLVGGASLDVQTFADIVHQSEIYR